MTDKELRAKVICSNDQITSADLLEELCAARTAWLESFGVPISPEFARFAGAIGKVEDALLDREMECRRLREAGEAMKSAILDDARMMTNRQRDALTKFEAALKAESGEGRDESN
jgi:hypothetical protein